MRRDRTEFQAKRPNRLARIPERAAHDRPDGRKQNQRPRSGYAAASGPFDFGPAPSVAAWPARDAEASVGGNDGRRSGHGLGPPKEAIEKPEPEEPTGPHRLRNVPGAPAIPPADNGNCAD